MKGRIRAKHNVFLLPASKNSDSQLTTHPAVADWRNLGKMKLNEPGRQKRPCKQAQHAKLYSDLGLLLVVGIHFVEPQHPVSH